MKTKDTKTIVTSHSELTFTVNYPEVNDKNAISDIAAALSYVGVFDGVNKDGSTA